MSSSEMLRRVAFIRSDVSDYRIAYIIRMIRLGELGTTLTLNSNIIAFPTIAFHRDIGVETVASIIVRHAISRENRLQHYVNEDVSRLLNVQHLIRRLKRTKPFELSSSSTTEGSNGKT
jgi:phosphopantetheine adenylyltransferase